MYDSLEITTTAVPEFIVNIAGASGIKLMRIFKQEEGCRFRIRSDDFRKFSELMARYNKEFQVIRDNSHRTFFRKNIFRIGLYLGVIAVIAVLIFYSDRITRVEIGELKWLNKEEIYDAVQSKLELPSKKTSIDCDELEKYLITLDGISSASVQIKGNTVLIDLYEELEKVPIIDKSDFSEIISKSDGIVTRVIVYSGSPVVKAGDTVKEGQTLISSDIVLDEEKGLTAKEKPLGEVYGRVWVTKSLTYYPAVMERKRTGRTETVVRAFAPQRAYKGKFTEYDRTIEEFRLDSIIPIKMYKTTYFETEEVEREFDFDANSEGIIKDATINLESELPEDCIKLRTWHVIKRLDKITYLEIYYEIEKKLN